MRRTGFDSSGGLCYDSIMLDVGVGSRLKDEGDLFSTIRGLPPEEQQKLLREYLDKYGPPTNLAKYFPADGSATPKSIFNGPIDSTMGASAPQEDPEPPGGLLGKYGTGVSEGAMKMGSNLVSLLESARRKAIDLGASEGDIEATNYVNPEGPVLAGLGMLAGVKKATAGKKWPAIMEAVLSKTSAATKSADVVPAESLTAALQKAAAAGKGGKLTKAFPRPAEGFVPESVMDADSLGSALSKRSVGTGELPVGRMPGNTFETPLPGFTKHPEADKELKENKFTTKGTYAKDHPLRDKARDALRSSVAHADASGTLQPGKAAEVLQRYISTLEDSGQSAKADAIMHAKWDTPEGRSADEIINLISRGVFDEPETTKAAQLAEALTGKGRKPTPDWAKFDDADAPRIFNYENK